MLIFIGAICGVVNCGAQSAQSYKAANSFEKGLDMPSAPASYILDEAGIFAREADKFHEISAWLARIDDEHNFPIYLVTSENFTTGSLNDIAQDYYERWLKHPNDGLVIYYDRDTKERGVGRRKPDSSEKAYDDMVEKEGGTVKSNIPDYLVEDAFSKVEEVLSNKKEAKELPEGHADFLHIIMKNLTMEFSETLTKKKAAANDSGGWSVIWWILPLVLLGAVACWFFQVRQQKTLINASEEYWFPKVLIGTRLGAKFGGGKGGEISFGD